MDFVVAYRNRLERTTFKRFGFVTRSHFFFLFNSSRLVCIVEFDTRL